jgi:hypothetical protein
MLGKIFDNILGGEEELEAEIEKGSKKKKPWARKRKIKFSWSGFLTVLAVFLLALVPRLVYIFYFSNPNFPGWYTDTFHHWQVAYLSKEVGFSQGFLRLWDFKGMEFFWGLLHPLVLAALFWLTGSIDILIPRLLSTVGGSVSIVLLFLLIKRYFNRQAAWATAIFASFFPITLFSNTVGMQEELGMPLVLGAILLWPQLPVVGGILLALASMVRAEYWLFCFGLVGATLLLRKHFDKAAILLLTYGVIILVYMKYLANWTGNYIYPVYWNFLASVKGEWFENLPVVGEKLLAKQINQGIFGFGIFGALLTLIKKPKEALLFLFGFGNILFIGFMVGFGSYVKGYIPRFWVDRLYNWPYLFTAILVIIFLFYYLPGKIKRLKTTILVFSWIFLAAAIIASQLIWKPINYFMEPVEAIYNQEKEWAREIADAYQDGKVLLPEDRPYITYFLAHDYGISAKNMEGQMFDPFFYFDDQDNLFSNWGEDRKIVLDWLKERDIKLIALTVPKPTYLGLIEREPEFFIKLPSERVALYRVNID